MRFFSLFFLITLFFATVVKETHIQGSLPADITSLVVDLKYNRKQGVKICEIQPVSESRIRGYGYATHTAGVIEKKFCQVLHQYCPNGPYWFFPNTMSDSEIKRQLKNLGWIDSFNARSKLSELFATEFQGNVEDKTDLASYKGVVYFRPLPTSRVQELPLAYRGLFLMSPKEFYKHYPHLLLVDAAFFPYANDKYLVNHLMAQDPRSNRLKPRWKSYYKQYTSSLARQIITDIGGDIFVIKPRSLVKGKGVFIVHKKDLDETLQKLLIHRKTGNPAEDKIYADWFLDRKPTFLVEEFVRSDPITVEHFNSEPFDATMRVVLFLTYHQNEINVHFLGSFWKLPYYSLNAPADLTEKHKSYGTYCPYFTVVDPQTLTEVENQLEKGLKAMYEKMLKIN